MSRYGGFRKGKSKIFNNWTQMKTDAAPSAAPTSIQDFKYTDAKGIWDLGVVSQFPKSRDKPVYPWGHLGTPIRTAYQNEAIDIVGIASHASNAVVAIDLLFSSTDSGYIFEIGGTAGGIGVAMTAGGTLLASAFDGSPWQSSSSSYVSTSVSSYYSTPGTWYFAVNYATKQMKVYFESTLVATGTTADGAISVVWGTSPGNVGQLSASYPVISTITTGFTGTINSVRIWTNPTSIEP